MRTTIDLDDSLFRQAKSHAALQGIRFKDVVENALRQNLASAKPSRRKRIKLPLWGNKKMGILDIPDDIAHRAQQQEDLERYEASL